MLGPPACDEPVSLAMSVKFIGSEKRTADNQVRHQGVSRKGGIPTYPQASMDLPMV